MPVYRLFSLKDGKIIGPPATMVCDSDQSVIKGAKALQIGLDIEIRDGHRVIARLRAMDGNRPTQLAFFQRAGAVE
jgi:hypothetical protein